MPGTHYSQNDLAPRARRTVSSLIGLTGMLALSSCNRLPLDDPRVTCHVAADPVRITMPTAVRSHYQSSRRFDDPALETWNAATIQIGTEQAGACQLHARGNNSKRFARKSYTVKLPAKPPVLPGVKMRRVFLLNLAFDPHQFEMRFADACHRAAGLFSPDQLLTRVFVNNEDEGLYLLCERHHTSIRRSHPDVSLIVRCQVHHFSPVWPTEDADRTAVVHLRRAMQLEDVQQRAKRFEALIDVDALLRWMACNSLMKNADTAGELFLFERRQPGQRVGRFSIMGWDYDDLNRAPDHPDMVLEHPLTWASENDLEKTVLTTAPLLKRYRETLRSLLHTELSQTAIDARLESLRVALNAAEPNGSRNAAIAEFATAMAARRDELLKNLDTP